jgi:serine O-acetyltransferase
MMLQTRQLLGADYRRLTGASATGWWALYAHTFRDRAYATVFAYRVLSGSLHNKVRFHALRLLMAVLVPSRKDMDIDVRARIGPGLVVYHGSGLVVGSGITAGANLTLEHGVTLGNRIGSSVEGAMGWPTLGNDCFVGCGAAVLGPIRLGDGVRVGANAVVLTSVPDGCTAVGVPARTITPRTPRPPASPGA